MVKHSAGIALWRTGEGDSVELLLVHPGGPYWKGKNEHAWSIPKGEFDPQREDPEECARREFAEELGTEVPLHTELIELPVIKASGKHIHSFLAPGDFEPSSLRSNTTEIEWPPRSGHRIVIPEVDAAAWIRLDEAVHYLHKGQARLVDHVVASLRNRAQDSS
ncbi:MAG: NUDIX domain-containing protein [Acidimicrobiia bacterium]|nr:NUDIX domain-containing protein [Acidimicrobiia bacterium]